MANLLLSFSQGSSARCQRSFWRIGCFLLGLLGSGALSLAVAPARAQTVPSSVFEIALPDLGIGPTAQPELPVPDNSVPAWWFVETESPS